MTILDEFALFSGLVINYSKTEAMRLGSKDRIRLHYGTTWTYQIKILGVTFSNEKTASCILHNWTTKIDNIKRMISQLERRNLSLLGKVYMCYKDTSIVPIHISVTGPWPKFLPSFNIDERLSTLMCAVASY